MEPAPERITAAVVPMTPLYARSKTGGRKHTIVTPELSDIDPRKNPSSRSNRSPHLGHSLLTSNHVPSRKSVAPPQLGQRLRRPRATTWSRVTFMGAPRRRPSGSQLKTDEPANLDVLARLGDRLRQDFLHRLLRDLHKRLVDEADRREILLEFPVDDLLGGRGRLALDRRGGDVALLCYLRLRHLVAGNVERACGGDLEAEVPHERLEPVVPGDEVRLAIDLDQDADLRPDVDVALDQPLLRRAVGLLGGRRGALLAQDRDGFVGVAVRFDQRLLAVEEARAGQETQVVDHSCGYGGAHVIRPSPGPCGAGPVSSSRWCRRPGPRCRSGCRSWRGRSRPPRGPAARARPRPARRPWPPLRAAPVATRAARGRTVWRPPATPQHRA